MKKKATITVKRDHRFFALLRGIGIYIDGKKVHVIRRGKEFSFNVKPGKHEIHVTMDWTKTEITFVELAPREEVVFICGIKHKDIQEQMRAAFFDTRNYLYIRRESSSNIIQPSSVAGH